jgi:hypothetical protein
MRHRSKFTSPDKEINEVALAELAKLAWRESLLPSPTLCTTPRAYVYESYL